MNKLIPVLIGVPKVGECVLAPPCATALFAPLTPAPTYVLLPFSLWATELIYI